MDFPTYNPSNPYAASMYSWGMPKLNMSQNQGYNLPGASNSFNLSDLYGKFSSYIEPITNLAQLFMGTKALGQGDDRLKQIAQMNEWTRRMTEQQQNMAMAEYERKKNAMAGVRSASGYSA
jgi:hypothetical protein